MAFLSDPYQRQQLALMLAGGTSGMGGVPRLAGWSAPIGALGRGLASTVPYMIQEQQYQQDQQQQLAHQQAMSQALQTTMQGLPGAATNPYLTAAQGMAGTDPEVALKMMQTGLGYTPPESKPPAHRQIIRGSQVVEQDWNEQSKAWEDTPGGVGSRFAPVQGPPPPEKLRLLSAMGIDPRSPEGQRFLMGDPSGKAVSPGGVSETQFQTEEKLRDDFNQLPEVKSYKVVLPVIQSAYDTLGHDNHASDLNLIYAIGKIMDPNSVVREGEMVMVQNAASPANQITGYLNYLTGGGKFTPELRQQLITELQSRVDALQSQYGQAYSHYSDVTQSYGLDVSRTLGKPSKQLGQPDPPPSGFVMDH